MWDEWLHLWIAELTATNRKILKNAGLSAIYLHQHSLYGSYKLFLSFTTSVPLLSSAFCAYHTQFGVDGSISWGLRVSCVLLHKRVCLFSILQFHLQTVQVPCCASITWFIFSLTFSIFPFSFPLLCAVLIGLFMMTLPYASFIYLFFYAVLLRIIA